MCPYDLLPHYKRHIICAHTAFVDHFFGIIIQTPEHKGAMHGERVSLKRSDSYQGQGSFDVLAFFFVGVISYVLSLF